MDWNLVAKIAGAGTAVLTIASAITGKTYSTLKTFLAALTAIAWFRGRGGPAGVVA